jgi:hypothetical protein
MKVFIFIVLALFASSALSEVSELPDTSAPEDYAVVDAPSSNDEPQFEDDQSASDELIEAFKATKADVTDMLQAGKDSAACKDMAQATEDDVKASVAATQKAVDNMPNGQHCANAGQDLVKKAEDDKVKAAKAEDDAKKALDAANQIKVNFGDKIVSSLTEGKCANFWTSLPYTNAKKKIKEATDTYATKKAEHQAAVKAIQTAKDEAAKMVRKCKCDALSNMQKAVNDFNTQAKDSNTKAWTKAYHMKCVIDGKTVSQCTVPSIPVVKMAPMHDTTEQCGGEAHKVINELTGGTKGPHEKFELFKFPATTGWSDNQSGMDKYVNFCLGKGLKAVGCGTKNNFDASLNDKSIAMPVSWGCNMMNPLGQHSGFGNNLVALQERIGNQAALYKYPAGAPNANQKLSPVCGKKLSGFGPEYLGCYKDDGNRDFKHGPKNYGFTANSCMEKCKTYKYIALQNDGWCVCDNTYSTPPGTYPKIAESKCAKGGGGKGGAWANSVYSNKYFKKPVAKTGHLGNGVYRFAEVGQGEWRLVRRVKAGDKWHPAKDQMTGSEAYGAYSRDYTADSTFSLKFDTWECSQYLFATGDMKKWLVAPASSVLGWYTDADRLIYRSSTSGTPYKAKWYRRKGSLEDPWISLIDHASAISKGDIVYGENSYGGAHASPVKAKGANVFCLAEKAIHKASVYKVKKYNTKCGLAVGKNLEYLDRQEVECEKRTTLSGGNDGNAKNLKACKGECDKDSQCAAGLKCFQRSNGEPIPGCKGPGHAKDWDYCYDPKTANSLLVGFHLIYNGCGVGSYDRNYQATCTDMDVAVTGTGKSYMRPCSAFNNKKLEYLDRQSVFCKADEALTYFKVVSTGCGSNDKRYTFTCDKLAGSGLKTTDHYSTCGDSRGKPLEYLDKANVKCPADTVLNGFHFSGHGCGGNNMKYKFKCVALPGL